jgi:hypothetical protein
LLAWISGFAVEDGVGAGVAARVANKNPFETLSFTLSKVAGLPESDLPLRTLNTALSLGQVIRLPFTFEPSNTLPSFGQADLKAMYFVELDRNTKMRLDPEEKTLAVPIFMELLFPRFTSLACAGKPIKAAAPKANAPATAVRRFISTAISTAGSRKTS